ncbi:hypothetical protein [Solicola sp. PLA-1-18]|uniref:hypothetical protein n=1 Tax=Solicola sp. PLA-1-18 TaxID=3380532 RepID=UPI003B76EFFC
MAMSVHVEVRPDALKHAHRLSMTISDADLVAVLADKLGPKVVADIVQKDRSCISRWRAGAKVPTGTSQTLRLVLQIFSMLEVAESEDTVRAWFLGMNPELDFAAPAEVVRIGKHRDVMEAARSFLDAA